MLALEARGLDRTSRHPARTLAMEIPLSHCGFETGCEVGAVAVDHELPSESRQVGDQADSEKQALPEASRPCL